MATLVESLHWQYLVCRVYPVVAMHLLALPGVMLEHALSFMSFDQVARLRLVCRDFDAICQRVLNRGFQLMEKRLTTSLRAIKAQLPRRESERRFHPLAKHCDILISVETRVSMLSMAYSRYIEQGRCCFIPGKILDELHRVLTIVNSSNPLPLAFEVLQELRDISGMAIEHFDEAVAPTLRQKMDESPNKILVPFALNRGDIKKITSKSGVGASVEMALLREACLKNNKSILKIEKRNKLLTRKLELYKRMMTLAKRQMIHKQIEQSYKIAELKRKVDEYEIKFNELSLTQHSGYKNCFKDTDTLSRISTTLPKSSKLQTIKMRPKNFSSQIKLDPSPLRIGLNKCGRGSPITKPRRASLNLPSSNYLEDAPTTSSSNLTNVSNEIDENVNDDRFEYTNKYTMLHNEVDNVLQKLNDALQEPEINKQKRKLIHQSSINNAKLDKSSEMSMPGSSKIVQTAGLIDDLSIYDIEKDSCDSNPRKKRSYIEQFKQNIKSSKDDTTIQALSKSIIRLLDAVSEKRANSKRRKIQSE